MLVIPAIDLQHGRCVRSRPGGAQKPTGYFDDPVRMAKLWRILNAKALHLMDLDGLVRDEEMDRETRARIGAVCEAVDIPVQVRGGVRTLEDIDELSALGVYRLVIGSAVSQDEGLLGKVLERYSSSRVVVAVDIRAGKVVYEDALFAPERDPLEFVASLEDQGCRRILLTDMERAGTGRGLDLDLIRSIAGGLKKAHLTVCGGVAGYKDFAALADLKTLGVDSVVVDRAFYENAFPCQQFWCWNDMEHLDLDTFSTAQLKA
jgi:phosphoribosylformimino-5-aminoimidazole carboxamide ribotide isomerase